MLKVLPRLFLVVFVATLPGCSLWPLKKDKKSESAARIYEGDAPSLRFSDEAETPGSPINPR